MSDEIIKNLEETISDLLAKIDEQTYFIEKAFEVHPNLEEEIENLEESHLVDDYDQMDGDHESALRDAGWGTDEDYGYFGEDTYL
jgi:asparagine synthetase A